MDRVKDSKQDAKERIRNFEEVSFGYTEEEAIAEASRCLQCKKPLCIKGCPVEVDIPGFIKKIKAHDIKGAIDIIYEKNMLP